MAATADQLAALGSDPFFKQRIQALLVQQAGAVYAEDPATPNHSTRAQYAKLVFNNPAAAANAAAPVIANRTNLVASTVSYNFTDGRIQTDATDGAISSQLATDWNLLAGV